MRQITFEGFYELQMFFFTNFISGIACQYICKKLFSFLSKAQPWNFPYILTKSNEPQSFSSAYLLLFTI